MANISKKQVKEQLTALGVEFDTDDYAVLCGLLREAKANKADIIPNVIEPPEAPDVDVAAATGGTTDAIAPKTDVCGDCEKFETDCDSKNPMENACGTFSPKLVEPTEAVAEASNIIHIENRIKKRNVFLADAVRNESDIRCLNAEIGKRIYKGKIVSITTCKQCLVSDDGEWVTTFDIELKD